MTRLDLLSDTVYREQAFKQVDDLLDEHEVFPVKKAQIYGLRQIARQQPNKVEEFAGHQQRRAKRRLENASKGARPSLEAEVEFWKLVERLCNATSDWSVRSQGLDYMPTELLDENIPANSKGMSPADRGNRRDLKNRQREWFDKWSVTNIPVFFERFCTHALYRLQISKEIR